MKNCPSCENKVPPSTMECECGYDFTKMDCPGCDARIPDDSVLCPECRYDLIEERPAGTRTARKKKLKPIETVVSTDTRTVVRSLFKHKTHVPATFHMANWPELKFSGPENDQGMIHWAQQLRQRADRENNEWLSNHAVACVAEESGSKFLEKNHIRLRDLLGGDDWK